MTEEEIYDDVNSPHDLPGSIYDAASDNHHYTARAPAVSMNTHPENLLATLESVVEESNDKYHRRKEVKKRFNIIWLCLTVQCVFIVTTLGLTAKAKINAESAVRELNELNSNVSQQTMNCQDLQENLNELATNVRELQDTGIRLTSDNEVTSVEGRLEILQNGEWGNVCSYTPHFFNTDAAYATCRMLGYPYGSFKTGPDCSASYGPPTLDITVQGYDCNGTERNLYECKHANGNPSVGVCSHSYDVCVSCTTYRP